MEGESKGEIVHARLIIAHLDLDVRRLGRRRDVTKIGFGIGSKIGTSFLRKTDGKSY